ncbi:YidC/Oxa1 family membrane protein insertase [Enterococcus canis]|uniref:Membrane protein insertase YidC n=1 Tax=Enterococcus canis TaxID=214095 RepID=A0A1L8RJR9_9ENTE|nr:membrane protein insertase YidC [Enterococcus canis]OJG19998.1 YidC/Oxa1 family membrane protein insertase [Enterococcus canis]
MNKLKKWALSGAALSLLLFLSGCVQTKDGQPTGEGWVYKLLVEPMANAITYLVQNFNWNYGWAIIFITIIVRLVILPLGLQQSRKSMIQTEKMAALKPQIDAAQAKLKAATTREEQMQAQTEMQQVYKDNGMSMMGGIGCLPLLIQMPIFSALFYAARYTPGINEASFFGINLGQPSLVFVVLAGIAYLFQSYLSTIGIPEEQKKTMRTMLIVSPLMIVFMSFSSPAGVALYWVVGGVFSCLQTFITNIILKPRIKAQIQEELKKNPPKTVVTPRKDVTPKPAKPVAAPPKKNGNGRNAGKQQRK